MLPKQYNTGGNTADNTNCKCFVFLSTHTSRTARHCEVRKYLFGKREQRAVVFTSTTKVPMTTPRWASPFMWLSWTSTVRTDGKNRITQKDRLWQQISIRISKIWHDFPKMDLEREWTRKWVGLENTNNSFLSKRTPPFLAERLNNK